MASIDVLLPFYVFGDHAFLTRAVDSVYRQSLPPRQLLILVNGGKHHDRVSCIEHLVALVRRSHPLDLHLINCACSGISAALNYGLSMSDAEFVSRLDADDVMLPGRHRFMLDYLDICRTGGLSVPDVLGTPVLVDGSSSSGVIGRLISKPTTDAAIRLNLLWGNPFVHPTVLLRRQLVLDIGGYRPIKAAEDLDLWLRLARRPGVTFANLSIPLTRYTVAPGSLSHSPDSFLGSAQARLLNIRNPLDLLLHSPKIGFDLARYLWACFSGLRRR